MTKWRKRLLIGAVMLVLVGTIGWLVMRQAVGPMIRAQLVKQIEKSLAVRADLGAVTYKVPFGVSLGRSSIVDEKSGKTLLTFKSAGLQLAEVPQKDKPIVVREFDLEEMELQADAINGDLLRKTDEPGDGVQQRLSEVLELRKVGMRRGQVKFAGITLSNLSADATLTPRKVGEKSIYTIEIAGGGSVHRC